MTSSNRYSHSGAAFVVKRALASASPAVLISLLALLLIAVAACTGDDDGTPSASDSASPTSSLSATAAPSSTDNGDGGGNGNGQVTPTPSGTPGAEESPPPDNGGSGTATIDGVQYDFSVSTCAIQPELVIVIGFGFGPDGNPLIGTTTWNKLDLITGVSNAFEVGIGVNQPSLLSVGDQVFKMGSTVLGSKVDSLEIDVTAFDLTVSGMFVDLQAPEAPPVPGTFSVSCS